MVTGGMSASQLHTNLSSLCVWGAATTFWILAVNCLLETVAAPLSLDTSQTTESTQILVGAVSAILFITIVVYLIISCTDCYKSEVSTECHPATASSGVKWGGAGGYTAAASSDVNDRVLGAGFTGEVVIPTEGGGPLPYAMIPTQVPEAQGFRGYGSAEPTAPQGYGGGGGMAGMGGQWGGAGGSQNLPGAHFSPMDMQEPQEPPPPYTSSSYQ